MTITSIPTYVTTADEFIAHATDVNADRVANTLPELAWPGGYQLADFIADRDALDAKITELIGLENGLEQAIDNRDSQRLNMHERLRQFRLAIRLYLKGTSYFKRVPKMPVVTIAESKFLRPFNDVAEMWQRIDADNSIADFTPPLLLTGNYTAAGFTADLDTMRDYFKAVTEAENDEDIARKDRDAMLDPLRQRMYQYRSLIELEYGPGHPFTQSMPDVTSSSGGGSPSPPTAPTGLTLVAFGDFTVQVDWDDVAGADAYRVFKQEVDLDPEFVEEPTSFADSEATLGPYLPDSTLRVKVRAVIAGEQGPDSEVAEVAIPSSPPV